MTFRTETIGDCTLYLGDALDVLPTLGKVDLVCTDPPYGVLDESWDDMTAAELAAFSMRWLGAVRALSDTLVTFFGERRRGSFSSILTMLYPQVRQLIWNKLGGQAASERFFYAYESIYLCHTGEVWEESAQPKCLKVARLLREAREATGLSRGGVDMLVRGKKTGLCYRWEEACCLPTPEQVTILRKHLPLSGEFEGVLAASYESRDVVVEMARAKTAQHAAKSTDVLTFSVPSGKFHRCEKPVPLMMRLLEALPDAETVCDPFMGSGSTGCAAVKLGKTFIGIEKDPEHFATACRRIDEATRQPRLSLPEPVKPEQEVMEL